MRVLVACEFSGIVRDAFIRHGHDAVSVDLLPSELPGPHIIGDVLEVMSPRWDMMIAFPPCTYLCRSGAWRHSGTQNQRDSLEFVRKLLFSDINYIALENPVGAISSNIRKPTQIIQPWQFGHGETKTTCLWLKNLPILNYTRIVPGRASRVWQEPPHDYRWKNRSRTLKGIANAMAHQWGCPYVEGEQ